VASKSLCSTTGVWFLKAAPITFAFAGLIVVSDLLLAAPLSGAVALEISGAGATFPFPLYAKWADAYKNETGTTVNYQPIGSGAGIKEIQNQIVTFGASDMPLKLDLLNKSGLIQFPTVIGGVVPAVNIEGITSGGLKLDGATLAKIFLGDIKNWNDSAIARLNPDTRLPPLPIVVVRRLDGSGTTFLWTDCLSKVSVEWKSKVGSNTSVEWPTGIRANGNEGVASSVQNTKGAIGYVEYAYAKQKQLATVNLINKDGKTVEPSSTAFQAAAVNANWNKEDGFHVILTDEAGAASWPITGATFILIPKQPNNPGATGEALRFFAWAYSKGDKVAQDLDYVPLPKNVVTEIEKVWATQIKDASGKAIFAVAQ
jgi:phosphate transport system substrate-binding protein